MISSPRDAMRVEMFEEFIGSNYQKRWAREGLPPVRVVSVLPYGRGWLDWIYAQDGRRSTTRQRRRRISVHEFRRLYRPTEDVPS